MKKHIYKYLILLVTITSLVIYTISNKYDILTSAKIQTKDNIFSSNGENLIPANDVITVTEIKDLSMPYPLNKMYKVGDEKAYLYSLSYKENKLNVGDALEMDKDRKYAPDQLYMLFRESYPNITVEEMGLDTPEQAYQAIQLAIWEMGCRTGISMYGSELSYIASIRADMGEKNIDPKVFNKAKQLVEMLGNYDYLGNDDLNLIPTLIVRTLDVKRELMSNEDSYLIGPYEYKVQTGIITNVDITLSDNTNEKVLGTLVDSNGNKIEDYKAVRSVYIKVPKEYKGEMDLTVSVEVKRLVPVIYNANDTDYIANSYVANEMQQSVKLTIN